MTPNKKAKDVSRQTHQTNTVLSEPEDVGELPPPLYGDAYGELRDDENGLGTAATIANDGRVNIHINQLNQRLSRLLAPALHQDSKIDQQSGPPLPPYIPSSLCGDKTTPLPPCLNVVIQVVGSRGDVQPFVALGKILKEKYGHQVRLATHAIFKSFVEDNGLEFFSIGGDPAALMAFMVQNPSLMPGFRSLTNGSVNKQRENVSEYIQGCWRACYEAGDGLSDDGTGDEPERAKPFVADCIIANPPSFAHIHCAERLSVPLHIMFTMPYSPTQAFPHWPISSRQMPTLNSRHRGAHVSKGLGRFATALTSGPMEIALSMNKGLYNLPRVWGDDTVRRPDRVTGFRSGFKAAGKDFGLGWYEGITGLVTQPWTGAQKEGASGFFKGVGKGVGGFVAKPCATIFGVPGYMMKGVQKGCQKWFTTNVQDYIFASRVAQGYEEWKKSSEEERREVIKQ